MSDIVDVAADETPQMDIKDLEDALGKFLSAKDRERVLRELAKRLQVKRYVEYVPLSNQPPSQLMQPKVRQVYAMLLKKGAMTLPELCEAMGEGFARNTVRYAIAILRQAGMVASKRHR